MRIPKMILALSLAAAAFVNIGCTQSRVRTYEERKLLYTRILDKELRQATEDFDLLILMDQPSHLSKWRED